VLEQRERERLPGVQAAETVGEECGGLVCAEVARRDRDHRRDVHRGEHDHGGRPRQRDSGGALDGDDGGKLGELDRGGHREPGPEHAGPAQRLKVPGPAQQARRGWRSRGRIVAPGEPPQEAERGRGTRAERPRRPVKPRRGGRGDRAGEDEQDGLSRGFTKLLERDDGDGDLEPDAAPPGEQAEPERMASHPRERVHPAPAEGDDRPEPTPRNAAAGGKQPFPLQRPEGEQGQVGRRCGGEPSGGGVSRHRGRAMPVEVPERQRRQRGARDPAHAPQPAREGW